MCYRHQLEYHRREQVAHKYIYVWIPVFIIFISSIDTYELFYSQIQLWHHVRVVKDSLENYWALPARVQISVMSFFWCLFFKYFDDLCDQYAYSQNWKLKFQLQLGIKFLVMMNTKIITKFNGIVGLLVVCTLVVCTLIKIA